MDFPNFDGSDVRIWPNKCSTYFELYAIPPDFRVTLASLHKIDRASHISTLLVITLGNILLWLFHKSLKLTLIV
jgi:hypothetical protein